MKSILRCKEAGIDVPTLYFHNAQTNAIVFEEIEGCSVKDYLASVDLETQKEDVLRIARSTGTVIGKLHQLNIAHGDLTTSNVMLRDRNPDKVVLIDFGLSTNRTTPEDFGVDLYVLERAVKSTHVEMDYFTDEILSAYGASWKGAKAALNKLAEVRLRGRKREIVGWTFKISLFTFCCFLQLLKLLYNFSSKFYWKPKDTFYWEDYYKN